MLYTDTILKNKDIKWKQPKIKYVEDGKMDMILTIALTNILERQAFRSFNLGVVALLQFMESVKDLPLDETKERLQKQIKEWSRP